MLTRRIVLSESVSAAGLGRVGTSCQRLLVRLGVEELILRGSIAQSFIGIFADDHDWRLRDLIALIGALGPLEQDIKRALIARIRDIPITVLA